MPNFVLKKGIKGWSLCYSWTEGLVKTCFSVAFIPVPLGLDVIHEAQTNFFLINCFIQTVKVWHWPGNSSFTSVRPTNVCSNLLHTWSWQAPLGTRQEKWRILEQPDSVISSCQIWKWTSKLQCGRLLNISVSVFGRGSGKSAVLLERARAWKHVLFLSAVLPSYWEEKMGGNYQRQQLRVGPASAHQSALLHCHCVWRKSLWKSTSQWPNAS